MNRTSTLLLLAVGSLIVLSLTMLASATMLRTTDTFIVRQAWACGIGFVALITAALVDFRWIQRATWVFYGGVVVLLALTLSPLGSFANGAQRWLFGTQPSELTKPALVLALAWFGSRYRHRVRNFSTLLGLGAVAGFPILLILLEPDKGTAALLGVVTLLVMLVSGARWVHVILLSVVGAGALVAAIAASGYAKDRMNKYAQSASGRSGDMQLNQSLYAFSEGGVDGKGLGRGTLKFKVPEQHTDFIFPVIGEELGLVATLGVVGAFLVILLCGATITHRAVDPFHILLAAGITFIIAGQACINMGVVTGLLPNKGIALPFVSRGGSGIVAMLTLVGLLLNISRQTSLTEPAARSAANPFADADTDLPQ